MSDEEKRASFDEKKVQFTSATPEEEKRLVRKLDRRILPITCLLYFFACMLTLAGSQCHTNCELDLDRTNLGNARLQGLVQENLHGDPTGKLFDWVNSAFFFSYVSNETRWFLILGLICCPPDYLPSACNDNLKVISTILLGGLRSYWVGYLFYFDGESYCHLLFMCALRFDWNCSVWEFNLAFIVRECNISTFRISIPMLIWISSSGCSRPFRSLSPLLVYLPFFHWQY